MEDKGVSSFSPLPADATCDVCIVGAGIAGLSVAYFLSKEKKSVIVLDDGSIGGGESERTTAHLSNALDEGYVELERMHGKAVTKLAAESHTAAIDTIEKIVKAEKIDCDFERVDGYLFLGPGEEKSDLDEEIHAAQRAGLKDVEWVQRVPLDAFDTGPALRFPNQGQFHLTKYLAGLAKAITNMGGKIHCNTHVSEVHGGDKPNVVTESGHTVAAADIVLATNSPIHDNALLYAKQSPYRTYVLGMTIPRGSVPAMLLWDTADPYHYVRTCRDPHGKGDVLIVGGEDHKTGQQDDAGLRFARLEAWAHKRFPMIEELRWKWSGQVMEPVDGLAYIGRDTTKDGKHLFIVTGDSGHGITHGTIAGILLTDLIFGRKNPWADIYSPFRSPLHATGEFLKEGANIAAQYADWMTPGAKGTDDMQPDSGRIVRKGLTKIAVYRDGKGALHHFSAVCPHKGCIVQWNSFEKTWDCPCHGSRYEATGRVLNGPTIEDLRRME